MLFHQRQAVFSRSFLSVLSLKINYNQFFHNHLKKRTMLPLVFRFPTLLNHIHLFVLHICFPWSMLDRVTHGNNFSCVYDSMFNPNVMMQINRFLYYLRSLSPGMSLIAALCIFQASCIVLPAWQRSDFDFPVNRYLFPILCYTFMSIENISVCIEISYYVTVTHLE